MVEEDGHDVGFTTFDYGCTYCLPDFVDGKPVRQRIEPRGKWMCCVKCGGSYGEVPAAAAAPSDAQPYLDAIDGALLMRAAKNGSAAAQEKLAARAVTSSEDRWLRNAAKRSGKVVAPGKLATQDAAHG